MPHHFHPGSLHDPCLHLFVDDFHVRNVFAMRRVFGRPRKMAEPALQDTEGRYLAWGCVRQDAHNLFRIWYQSPIQESPHELATAGVWGRGADYGFYPDRHAAACHEWETSCLSYAESTDGLHWHRPEVGLVEWRGSRRNNIVLSGLQAAKESNGLLTNLDTVSVVVDERAADHERYKLICHWETIHVWDNAVSNLGRPDDDMTRFRRARGKYMLSSPDGIHWDSSLVHIKGCAGGGDYAGVTRDERNGRWWFNDRAPVGMPDVGFRSAGLCTSPSLNHWPETVEQIVYPGEFEDWGLRYEHHGMIPFNYGDQDLGYLELSVKGAPVANILLTHRDGQPWQRPNGNEPLIQVGERGSFDDRIVNAMRNPPLIVGDEIVIPYNGRFKEGVVNDRFKGRYIGSLGLATLRLDGFAGFEVCPFTMHRYGLAASLQSQPVLVSADDLQVNLKGHRGTARVALLDEGARGIEGYGLTDCLPIDEDNVRATVRWKERNEIRSLRGRKVMFLIQLQSGSVWSFRL